MSKKKAFLIGPISAWMNKETGEIEPNRRMFLESIIGLLESRSYEVLSAARTEEWGKAKPSNDALTERDYRWIREADLVVALPGDPASGGTHIELGWRTAHGGNLAILVENSENYSPLLHGLPATFNDVRQLPYSGQEDCLAVLGNFLDARPEPARFGIVKRLATAATLTLALGIGTRNPPPTDTDLLVGRQDVLRDYAHGLMLGKTYTGLHGTVLDFGDIVAMYPSDYDPKKLRLNGIMRAIAVRYVEENLKH